MSGDDIRCGDHGRNGDGHFFSGGRFDLGWYTVRIFGVVSSTAVLLALLTEITRLHAKLSVTVRTLERERDNKLLNAQAATDAMAHEIRQPLATISLNGSAALAFLKKVPPKLSEVQDCVERMTAECYGAADVIEGIRNLFRKEVITLLGSGARPATCSPHASNAARFSAA